jgi:hypothetical protein
LFLVLTSLSFSARRYRLTRIPSSSLAAVLGSLDDRGPLAIWSVYRRLT